MKTSSYNKDAIFGELAETNFINFYKELNKNNDIYIHKIGYTETLRETADYIIESDMFKNIDDENIKNRFISKIITNYNNMIEINKNSIFFNRFGYTSNKLLDKKYIDLYDVINNKALFKNDDEINLNYRTQKLGIDLIILKNDKNGNPEITFLELKSFKAVDDMYLKLGLEYFSKWFPKEDKNCNKLDNKEDDAIGYSFSMCRDILVYRQDVNVKADKDNKNKIREEIDKTRLYNFNKKDEEEFKNDETYTHINVFKNFDFLRKVIEYTNNLNDNFYFHSIKTNNYHSVYTNVNYSYFKDCLIKKYIYNNKEITKI